MKTSCSSVAAMTYQAPSRSPSSNSRWIQVISPDPTSPSIAGDTSGDTTYTSPPEAIRVGNELTRKGGMSEQEIAARSA